MAQEMLTINLALALYKVLLAKAWLGRGSEMKPGGSPLAPQEGGAEV